MGFEGKKMGWCFLRPLKENDLDLVLFLLLTLVSKEVAPRFKELILEVFIIIGWGYVKLGQYIEEERGREISWEEH